jgi:hypothetical protein
MGNLLISDSSKSFLDFAHASLLDGIILGFVAAGADAAGGSGRLLHACDDSTPLTAR